MCNVALLDSVSMCMCPCAPVFVRVHSHNRMSASAYVCARGSVFVCLCRSIKFCSHSCRLVSAWLWSVCLPLNLQPLLLFDSPLFLSSEFFICIPLLLSLYLLPRCFLCDTLLPLPWCPLHPSFWTIPPRFFLLHFGCFHVSAWNSWFFFLLFISHRVCLLEMQSGRRKQNMMKCCLCLF